MRYAKFVIGGAVAVATVPLGALPAYAAGPPSPPVQPGCTFNGSTGQSTCVTTHRTTTTVTVNANGVSGGTDLGGGVTGAELCAAIDGPGFYPFVGFTGLVFDLTTTTTTTTVHQGVSSNGHVVSATPAVTHTSFIIQTIGFASC